MKPTVRVTTLESWRRWRDNPEDAPFEITEGSVIEGITGTFQGNRYTRIGTAFHRIVEEGAPRCRKVPAGERTFTRCGRGATEAVPCGRAFDVDGTEVVMDVAQVKVALAYREENAGAFHETRRFLDMGPAIVTGCADMIHGVEIRDIKTKFGRVDEAQYRDSCQWRLYLQLFGLDTFHYDLFVFKGYNEERHGQDVRGLEVVRHPAITCHRYDGMERDNMNLLADFLEWAAMRGLTENLEFHENQNQ